ncbi:MAG: prolipoprotein diacylglyceryl transferase family protein [Bacillota bacterium]
MEAVVWQWGPFSIAVFSLAFFVAVISGLFITFAEGRAKHLPEQRIIDFIALSLVSGIAGSRLVYALFFDLAYYLENPIHLVRLQDGGLSFWGGLAVAVITVFIWAIRKKVIIERYLDTAAPALAAGLALGHIGALLRGKPMHYPYPWGIRAGELLYHPDGAYMIIFLVALLFVIRRRRSKLAYEGELFVWFLAGYGLLNFGVEFFRTGTPFLGLLTAGQVAALAVLLFIFLFMLGGSKIYTASYSTWKLDQGQSKFGPFLRLIWYLGLTALLIALYFYVRQPFSFL